MKKTKENKIKYVFFFITKKLYEKILKLLKNLSFYYQPFINFIQNAIFDKQSPGYQVSFGKW